MLKAKNIGIFIFIMFTVLLFKSRWLRLNEIKNIRKRTTHSPSKPNFLKRNLLLTNSLTSGACMALGDLVEQEFERRSGVTSVLDWTRIGNMFIVGTVLGPLHHYFYIGLDKIMPKVSVKNVFFKILSDQTIAGPLSIVIFYYGMGLLERQPLEVCTAEVKKKFLTTFAVDCLYWPPIQFFNFYYLPIHYRVIYINVATMVFNVFLSYMKHYDLH